MWLLLLKIENISFISCNTIYKNEYEYRKNIADMEHWNITIEKCNSEYSRSYKQKENNYFSWNMWTFCVKLQTRKLFMY